MGFFQKQFLLDVLKEGEDAWETENNGSVRLGNLGSKWRVLWPEANIINYASNGGLMKKGRLRPQTSKWARSELLKSGEEGKELHELIRGKG